MREAADEAAAIEAAAERFDVDPKQLVAARRFCRPRKSHRNREPLVRRLDNVIGRRVTLGDFEMELLHALKRGRTRRELLILALLVALGLGVTLALGTRFPDVF